MYKTWILNIVSVDLTLTEDGLSNKRVSYCSDTEAEREFRPSSGLKVDTSKHRRRGSDANYTAGPDGSLSPTSTDVAVFDFPLSRFNYFFPAE